MRRGLLALTAVVCLFAGRTWADSPSPKAGDKPTPKPIDGMLCVGKESVESPTLLPEGLDKLSKNSVPVPNCPVNYSNCQNVPGRSCTLQNCVTVDLEWSKCKRPGGIIISCDVGLTIHQTTCNCEEQFHSQCCDTGTCEWGDCGICSGGRLATFCGPP
jgi:hypothetical protein